jgi:hypothetical protein
MWRATPAGGRAYLVLDQTIAHLILHTQKARPQHPGFTLLSRTHYGGASASDLLVYLRTGR